VSVFLERNHLFLRSPVGGVEDVETMKAAGFTAIFCNIGDHDPSEWTVVRERAQVQGVVCGPWLRTADAANEFDPNRVLQLVHVADLWGSPVICNSESELKATGSDLTSWIAEQFEGRDWALSMEAWPFADVDWSPIRVPVLPQIFPAESGAGSKPTDCKWQWQNVAGIPCVVFTFGTYGEQTPDLYDLLAPYGLYTADDCGNVFEPWRARGSGTPCATAPPEPEEPMEKIGSQHGIAAMADIFRKEWPDKTGKPDPNDPATWKAIDKWERTMTILVEDHDAAT
jgi:hypothetical protein